jgi:hypothetical protein
MLASIALPVDERVTTGTGTSWCSFFHVLEDSGRLVGEQRTPQSRSTAWPRAGPGRPAGSAASLALAASARVHEGVESQRPRLVVTGPVTPSVPVRLINSVVTDIVRAGAERLLLVSFAAHGVAEVVRELVAAADRGVQVDLVLETTDDHGGRLRSEWGRIPARSRCSPIGRDSGTGRLRTARAVGPRYMPKF